MNDRLIFLTDTAVQHVRSELKKRGHGLGVRLGVKTSGCSGLAYFFEWLDHVEIHDHVEVYDDITLAVDKKSMLYVSGTTLDYTKEGLNSGFKLDNPNVQGTCGCGESFTV